MPATPQTIRMIRAALTADAGVTEEEASAVARLLEGGSPSKGIAPPDELLDEKAVQGILKLSHQTLWRLERSGELVAHRIGRTKRYSRRQVEDYIRRLG